jgi:hypothetical protein
MTVQSFKPGSAKVVTIPPRNPHAPHTPGKHSKTSKTSTKSVRRASIKKDDEWITSPSKPPTRTPKTVKKVTFAEPLDTEPLDTEPLDTVKENMKKPKVGKLFPELKARFEGQ